MYSESNHKIHVEIRTNYVLNRITKNEIAKSPCKENVQFIIIKIITFYILIKLSQMISFCLVKTQ